MSNDPFDNLLAIDTATRKLHLALMFSGDRVVKTVDAITKSHGQILMARIQSLCESAALAPNRLHGIIVGVGPGSFTGLRIGLAAAKGLAVAAEIPLLGIGLFELARHKMTTAGLSGAVIVPSRTGEYYFAAVGNASALPDVVVAAEAEMVGLAGGRTVYGMGFDPATQLADPGALSLGGELEYDGADVLYLGREKLLREERSDLNKLEPLYFQKAIAEVRFDERHGTDSD